MPTYDYRCPNGHSFELFHRMSDLPPASCEVCGAAPVERVLSQVAVHFKGSGFYSTDYGRGGSKREAEKDGKAASTETKKSDEKATTSSPSSNSSPSSSSSSSSSSSES